MGRAARDRAADRPQRRAARGDRGARQRCRSQLESRYDAMDVAGAGHYGKLRCKGAFQRDAGFPVRDDIPLIGAIGVVTTGNGWDALLEIAPRIARNDVQLAVIAEPGSDADL